MLGQPPQLRGFVCAYYPAAPRLNPKETIYDFFNLYCCNCYFKEKRRKYSKRGWDWPIFKKETNVKFVWRFVVEPNIGVKTTHRCPEALDLEKDVDDAAVADEGHDPEEEEHDAEEVADEGVDRRILLPVRMDDGHDIIQRYRYHN